MSARAHPEAIVVGAGIIGAACAEALSRAGVRVVVLESASVAAGTTSAGMGHLVALDGSSAQLALTAYSIRCWSDLAAELGPAVELDRCGTLWLAEDAAQLDDARARCHAYAAAGVAAEIIAPRELRELEPALRGDLAGAMYVPGDAVLTPPMAARRLLELACARGAVVRDRCTVSAIDAHAVHVGGESLRADVVVNAAGVRAPRLTPALPVVPRRGHLAITGRGAGLCRHQLVEMGYRTSAHAVGEGSAASSVAFNVQPRAGGEMIVGSSREMVGWDAAVDRAIVQRMTDRAIHFLPALARLTMMRVWTGFRPASSDGLPFIGEWPATPGLWVAAGHEGLGITAAAGTGRLLADLITRHAPAIDPAPYAPARVRAAMPS